MSVHLLERWEVNDAGREIDEARRRWIHVSEHHEQGRTEASFAFELAGVSARALERTTLGQTPARPVDLLDVLAVATAAGQAQGTVWFEYRSGGSQSFPCRCLIRGTASAPTADDALNRAVSIWQETAQAFGRADGDYVFEPTLLTDDFDNTLHPRTVRLRRASVLIGRSGSATAGFHGAAASERMREDAVSVPLMGDWGTLDRTIKVLASTPDQVAVRFAIEPLTLTLAQLHPLMRSLSWLTSPSPKGLAYNVEQQLTAGGDPALQAELSRTLACWIRRPSGLRVTAELRAQSSIPTAVMVALHEDMPGLSIVEGPTNVPATGTVDLAALAHRDLGFPGVLPSRPRLLELGARAVLASHTNGLSSEGPVVGVLPGVDQVLIRIPEQHRDQHCYLLGASGVGKSTLLFNSIVHDLASGHGVCLIDPHGELFDRVLQSIPVERVNDVVIIDSYDNDWSVGLNLLSPDGPDEAFERQVATSEMLRLFDRLYDLHHTGGPMFELYMRNAMFLVMSSPSCGGTLVEVVRVFEDRAFRDRLIASCADKSVVNFWKQVAEPATGEASLRGMAPYITCKLNQFTQNDFVRPIIGQSGSTLSFGRALNERKIILVNLAVGRLGVQDVQLLGMLVMSKLFRAAYARPTRPELSPRMHVYLDEFHYFLTDAMAGALSQLRKYNVCVTLSHQHLAQLVETRLGSKLLDAVLGNVSTKLLFRLGPGDAEKVAGWVGPVLRAEDLLRLANYEVAACLPSSDGPYSPMIARTLPAVSCKYERADVAELLSLKHSYSRRRRDVEADIAARP